MREETLRGGSYRSPGSSRAPAYASRRRDGPARLRVRSAPARPHAAGASPSLASNAGGLAIAIVFLVFLCRRGAVCLFGGEINGTVIAARRSRLQAKMLARRAEMEGKWTASST